MTDGKKDLTGLMDLPLAEPTADGSLPPELDVEPASVTIDSFESLEDQIKSHSGVAPDPFAPNETSSASDAAPTADVSAPDLGDFPPMDLAGGGGGSGSFSAPDPTGAPAEQSAPALPPMPAHLESFEAHPEPAETLEAVRTYAERLPSAAPSVPADFPFTLRVTGHLQSDERARFSDLITRENLGIREVDLEPQFEAGRILIPRVSEYAAVLLVQAIRGASVEIDLAPSDEAEATWNQSYSASEVSGSHHALPDSHDNPAESLPVTSDSQIPELGPYVVVDAVTASASLSSQSVEAEHSREYQELLEALQRELKYKAYRRGANAILCFQVTLTPLTLPSRYRLTVIGSAVKFAASPPPNH